MSRSDRAVGSLASIVTGSVAAGLLAPSFVRGALFGCVAFAVTGPLAPERHAWARSTQFMRSTLQAVAAVAGVAVLVALERVTGTPDPGVLGLVMILCAVMLVG